MSDNPERALNDPESTAHIESFLSGKPVFLTEHGTFSADNINVKTFANKALAQRHLDGLPMRNRTCYGQNAVLLKHLHVQED